MTQPTPDIVDDLIVMEQQYGELQEPQVEEIPLEVVRDRVVPLKLKFLQLLDGIHTPTVGCLV